MPMKEIDQLLNKVGHHLGDISELSSRLNHLFFEQGPQRVGYCEQHYVVWDELCIPDGGQQECENCRIIPALIKVEYPAEEE